LGVHVTIRVRRSCVDEHIFGRFPRREYRILRHGADAQPLRTEPVPGSGSSVPARIFSSVNFPDPFGPTNAT
jgi:hypothetical protein